MISIKELHAGDGYRYLLRGVVDREEAPDVSAVTAYYTEAGNPPGRWLGSGLAGLDGGRGVAVGVQVSEQQMERLYRSGADPVTGEALGRRYRVPTPLHERVAARVDALPAGMPADERAAWVERIEAEERARKVARPVSGLDVTFSPPKSVSVLWALADVIRTATVVPRYRESGHVASKQRTMSWCPRLVWTWVSRCRVCRPHAVQWRWTKSR